MLAAARIVVAVLAYQALLIAVSLSVYTLALSFLPPTLQGVFGLIGLGIAEGAALLGVLFVWRTLDRRPLRDLGLRPAGARRAWARGATAAVLMMGFVVLGWYTLVDGAAWDANPDLAQAAVVLLGGLLGYAIQGASEELLFRGHMFENIRQQWGLGWALGVTSVVFGLFHAENPNFGLLPLLNLVLFGLGAALYRTFVDDGQLWGVFGLHSVWNWLQQVVFGLPNSGIVPERSMTLFSVTPNTAVFDPIWGGGFGPEGTLGATLVLLALIGFCLRRRRRGGLQRRAPASAVIG